MFNETSYGLGDYCSDNLAAIYAAADKYGIDRGIALAQIKQESGCNPGAIGPATRYGTAKGMAQFIDSTFAQYGSGSPFDPASALDAWGSYMKDLLAKYGGDYSLALAAYNAGPGAVDKYGGVPPYTQTTNYVAAIMKALGFGGGGSASATDTTATSPDVTSQPVDLLSGMPAWLPVAALVVAAYFFLK